MATQGISQPAARNEPHTTELSDWEYEYDEHETEDIYFTLDLTTHVPNAIQEKQYAKNGKLIGPEKSGAENAPQDDDANVDAVLNGDDNPQNEDAIDDAAPLEAGRLQVLDLHTEKPYVKYNNAFYSCHWFTDLGTQFWITNPGVVSDPKLSGHVLDVVGSSQTRLVAKPANLKRKRDAPEAEHQEGETATQTIDIEDDAASDVSDADSRVQIADAPEQNPNEPMVVAPPKNDLHMQGQASFMERLSAIKLKKGESDAHDIPRKIPVYYKGAYNADELRAAHGVQIAELQPAPTPTVDRVSPTPDKDAGEGAPTPAPAPVVVEQNSPAPPPPPSTCGKRTRGGSRAPRGGAISNAARRSNLGLETTTTTDPSQPKRKRGRPSNAERALRAEAEAAATAASNTFALDPQLGGPTPPGAEDLAATATARSPSREASVAASSIQGGDRPRKRRRTAAQMEEARRLDEERQAKLAAAKAAKVVKSRREDVDAGVGAGAEETGAVLPAGQRSARRTRSSNAADEVKKIDDVGEGGEGDGPAADPRVEGDEKMPG
jgi:hypothetical protein